MNLVQIFCVTRVCSHSKLMSATNEFKKQREMGINYFVLKINFASNYLSLLLSYGKTIITTLVGHN